MVAVVAVRGVVAVVQVTWMEALCPRPFRAEARSGARGVTIMTGHARALSLSLSLSLSLAITQRTLDDSRQLGCGQWERQRRERGSVSVGFVLGSGVWLGQTNLFENCETNMLQPPEPGSSTARPPQLASVVLWYPRVRSSGLILAVAQPRPAHPGSQRQRPSVHTPSRPQRGSAAGHRAGADRPGAAWTAISTRAIIYCSGF